MGHVGLTPQAISVIGGFRAQGRTAFRARALLDEALRLQDAGCFAVVLECVPANVAAAITETLEIPTIGIGAGGDTSGQVLVFHDMLGMVRRNDCFALLCFRIVQFIGKEAISVDIMDGAHYYLSCVRSFVFQSYLYI